MPPIDSYSSPVDFRIGQTPPIKLTSPDAAAISELYASMQQMIQTLINYCGIAQQPANLWSSISVQSPSSTLLPGNLQRYYPQFTETVVTGAMVHLFSSGGVLKARNANAAGNTRWALAFANYGGTVGTYGEVIIRNGLAPVSGLTIGARYFLSIVDGLITAVAPVAAGNIEQYVGFGLTANILYFDPIPVWVQH